MCRAHFAAHGLGAERVDLAEAIPDLVGYQLAGEIGSSIRAGVGSLGAKSTDAFASAIAVNEKVAMRARRSSTKRKSLCEHRAIDEAAIGRCFAVDLVAPP